MNIRNLTPDEAWRIHGRLEDSHVEDLLDSAHAKDSLGTVDNYLDEIKAQMPEEDLLCGIDDDIAALIKATRGQTRVDLTKIRVKLIELATSLRGSMDEAGDCIRKAQEVIQS